MTSHHSHDTGTDCSSASRTNHAPVETADSTVAVAMSRPEEKSYNLGKLVAGLESAMLTPSELSSSAGIIIRSFLLVFMGRLWARPVDPKKWNRICRSFKRTFDILKRFENEDNWEQDVAKYFVGCLVAKGMGSAEMPPKPKFAASVPDFPPSLFVGWSKRFISRAIARRDLCFIYSLGQAKRAWPILSAKRAVLALKDHQDLLSLLPPEWTDDHTRLKKTIVEVAADIFRHLPPPTKFMPSGSACVQSSRGLGGTKQLFSTFVFPTGTRTSPQNLPLSDEFLRGDPVTTLTAELVAWRNHNLFGAIHKVGKELLEQMDDFCLPPGEKPISLADRPSRVTDCVVELVPEPAKFRTITKGCGYLYTAIQPAQGQLLSCWKNRPESTMLINDQLLPRIQTMYDETPAQWKFVSVDYKSATDTLQRWTTLAALEGIDSFKLFNADLVDVSVCEARLSYPRDKVESEDGKKVGLQSAIVQTSGQLMGHPLSFPLLCTINLACYRHAVKAWFEQEVFTFRYFSEHFVVCPETLSYLRSLRDAMYRNVLVNGDDMCFRAPESFLPFFWRATGLTGLRPSVGKNFVSDFSVTINSQLYELMGNGKMVRRGYLNLPLVSGCSLKRGVSNATPDMIGKDLNRMCADCPWAACAIPLAFAKWKSTWQNNWFCPNWFLPVHLGGYGVDPCFGPATSKLTMSQRLVAAKFVEPGSELRLFQWFNQVSMKMNLHFAKFLMVNFTSKPRCRATTEELDLESLSDEWMGRLAYASRAACDTGQLACQKICLGASTRVGAFKKLLRKRFVVGRLHPMKDQGISEWRDIVSFCPAAPVCPPLNVFADPRRKGFCQVIAQNRIDRIACLRALPFRFDEC